MPLTVVVSRAAPRSATDALETAGAGPVDFNFDWSFDFYPLAYHRPGPTMTIYRLHGGRC